MSPDGRLIAYVGADDDGHWYKDSKLSVMKPTDPTSVC